MRFMALMLGVCVPLVLLGQSPSQWSRHASDALGEGDVYGAAFYFGKAASADSSNLDVWLAWGDALRAKNDYVTAAGVYKYVYEHPFRNDKHAVALYHHARMMQSQGYYEDAGQAFRSYANYHAEKGSYLYQDAQRQESSCLWAMLHSTDTTPIKPITLGLRSNSIYSEFGSSLYRDSVLIYSSLQYRKKDSTMLLARQETGNRVSIYKAIWRDSLWQTDGLFDTALTGAFHYGNAHWFADSLWLAYTECTSYGDCRIFMRKWNDSAFGPPFEPGQSVNIEGFTSTHPHLAYQNGDLYLFFATNRPQGQGNMDVWFSKYEPRYKQFGAPRNAGREVNSPGNEITPFYLTDSNRLYFSSDWHDGLGGFDIFGSAVSSLRAIRKPENLKPPVNTPANDLYFAVYPSDSILFFSSNRPEGMSIEGETCCNDIYFYRIPPAFPARDTLPPEPDTTKPAPVPSITLHHFRPVLYFDNDHPHPRTIGESASLTYTQCYNALLKKREEYTQGYVDGFEAVYRDGALKAMDAFYNHKVMGGMDELQKLMAALRTTLTDGKKVTLVVQGFSSPLAASEYNRRLSQRRISTLINELKAFDNGALIPFMHDLDENNTRLTIREEPYGETRSDPMVSDDRRRPEQSVYSPDACAERRIEIMQIFEE